MAIVKILHASCLLALCGLTAACKDGSSASAPPAAAAAATAAPARDVAAAGASSTLAPADAAPSPTSGDASMLRPSYDACIGAAAGVTPAMQDCIDAEYAYQDGRLNAVYKTLMAKLGEAEQHALRERQRTWIADRDEKCFYDPDSGQAGRVDAAECRLDMTARRADELEAR